MVANPYSGPRQRPARQLGPHEQSTAAEVIYADSSNYHNTSQLQEMRELRARRVDDKAGSTSAELAQSNGDFIDAPPRPRQLASPPPPYAWGMDAGSPQRQEGVCAAGGLGALASSGEMGRMLAMECGATHGGLASLTDETRSSAFATTPAKVAARQAHLSSAAGQDSHTHNAMILRPASRPSHGTKGDVDEVVFGHDLDGSSADISPEEIFGWEGAGVGSKAQQARATYLLLASGTKA